MIDLDVLHEGAIQENVFTRYSGNGIYTFVGPILISVNPYEQLPIYGESIMKKYVGSTHAHTRHTRV